MHTSSSRVIIGFVLVASVAMTPLLGMAFTNRHSIDLERDFNQNAYHADAPALSPTGAMTIESWINLESINAGQGIVHKWTVDHCCNRSYQFLVTMVGGSPVLHAAISSDGFTSPGSYKTIEVPFVFELGQWYHVAFVFNPSTKMELFVDGVSIGESTVGVPAGINDNGAELQVGAYIDETGPSSFFDGKIDDVRLWGVARTASEIASNKDVELLGTESGLLGYWKFNGNALDVTTNGNHLSLRNGPVFHLEAMNNSPILAPIGNMVATEGQQLSFVISATDEDNDTLTYGASNLPPGATFNTQTRTFLWTPTHSQEGNYPGIEFVVTDSGSPMELDMEIVTITVGDNPTPTEQAIALINAVVNYDFPTNVENSYLANLKKVEKFIEEGKVTPAINQLDAFIVKVENYYALGVLTEAERDNLTSLANQLLSVLLG